MLGLALGVALAVSPGGGVREHLTLEPGDDCLKPDRLAQLVDGWLAEDTPLEGVTITVVPGERPALTFRIHRDGTLLSERTFAQLPDDCADRHALVGLSIAIGLDADAVPEAREVPTASAPAPTGAQPSATPPGEPARSSASARARFRPVPLLSVAGWASTAVFWTPAFGGRVEAGVEPAARVDVSAGFVAAGTPSRSLGSGEATGLLLAGTVSTCVGTRRTTAALRGCVGGVFGASRVAGSGFADDRTSTRAWAGLETGVRWMFWPVRRFGLSAQVALMIPITRVQAQELGPTGEVLAFRKTPPVGLAVAVGGVFSLARR